MSMTINCDPEFKALLKKLLGRKDNSALFKIFFAGVEPVDSRRICAVGENMIQVGDSGLIRVYDLNMAIGVEFHEDNVSGIS